MYGLREGSNSLKKLITHESGQTYEGKVCPCHHIAIWPSDAYDNHIERMRQIQTGELDPFERRTWQTQNRARLNKWKKRKKVLN